MVLANFGWSRRPFRPTPDLDSYFPSATHQHAVRALTRAWENRDGFALIDGEPGTGKTLAALRFLSGLPDDTPTAIIPAPRFTQPAELFRAILFDLGTNYSGLAEHELRLAVADKLLGGLDEGAHPTVIVLDEAQHLGPDLLEEVRLLGNLESRFTKAAFVALVGLPTLRERLALPDSAALAQRVAARARVEPLTEAESVAYVRHQLTAAGGSPDLIADEALALLAAQCRGIPRLLNQAAGLAFVLAAEAGEPAADVEPVLEALARLGLAPEEPAILPHPVQEPERPQRAAKPKARKRRSA